MKSLAFVLVAALALVACSSNGESGGEPGIQQSATAPVAETSPTQTPAPSPTATTQPTARPTAIPATKSSPTATPVPTASPQPTPALTPVQLKQYTGQPSMAIDPAANYIATIRTNLGDVVIELFPAAAPKTVNSFVFLANEGFYDDVVFHRVIENFMIQGGDPTGTGRGGPGYSFEDEFDPSLVFDHPGILAMANAGPNTNGSQFFITVAPTPHLNGAHTIFGQVIEGQGITDAISKVPADANNRPTQPVTIHGIEITEKNSVN